MAYIKDNLSEENRNLSPKDLMKETREFLVYLKKVWSDKNQGQMKTMLDCYARRLCSWQVNSQEVFGEEDRTWTLEGRKLVALGNLSKDVDIQKKIIGVRLPYFDKVYQAKLMK